MPLTQTVIPHAFAAATTVTGQQWDDNFNALAATMNSPLQPANYLLDTGIANTYAVAFGTGIVPTYTAGLMIQMLVLHSNSGASTVNVNGLGAKNILRQSGATLSASDLLVNGVAYLQYDGTQFQLLNPGAGAATSYLTGLSVVASATTPDIFNVANAATISYTGTATATGFAAAPAAGAQRKLICTGACLFTAGANLLIEGIPSGTTITLAANAIVDVVAITTTQFKMTYSVSGTFTITLTGCTVNPTGTASFKVENGWVNLGIPALSGTSNLTTATFTGLPAVITSTLGAQFCPVKIQDNATSSYGFVTFDTSTTGFISLVKVDGSGWTGSGTKAVSPGTFSYRL